MFMSDIYSVIAYIARYWFVALVLVIIWRALYWLRRDARRVSRALRRYPDAGYIGEWAVIDVETAQPTGEVLAAPQDGWLGSARGCDVCLPHADMPAHAARFFLRADGLHLVPRRSGVLMVDGEPVRREAVLRHGATVSCGRAALQLRLFAGVVLSGEKPGRKPRPDPEPVLPDLPPEVAEAEEEGAEAGDAPAQQETPSSLPVPSMTVSSKKIRRKTREPQTPNA